MGHADNLNEIKEANAGQQAYLSVSDDSEASSAQTLFPICSADHHARGSSQVVERQVLQHMQLNPLVMNRSRICRFIVSLLQKIQNANPFPFCTVYFTSE